MHRRAFLAVSATAAGLPGLSGLEVAGELAALRPELPVVISSGYVTEALLDAAGRLGVRNVMQKEIFLKPIISMAIQICMLW